MPRDEGRVTDGLAVGTDAGIMTVTIDRPARRNAITQAMWDALAGLFEAVHTMSPVRVVVIAGAGADFSAGADISEFDTVRKDPETALAYETANARAFAAIRHCPVPTIAAIRGTCFGGGFGIAAACDLRIAERDARFSVPAAKLGLAYPQDAMIDIVNACGPQLARYLMFSAARISAEEAFENGLALSVLEPGALEAETARIAGAIAANAPLSVRASKAAIAATLSGRSDLADIAARLGAETFSSEDYAEGRAAFRERRTPRFEGR